MTNGEKIIEVFNPEEIKFREIKGRVPTVLSFVGNGRIEVEQTWWNAEYHEPNIQAEHQKWLDALTRIKSEFHSNYFDDEGAVEELFDEIIERHTKELL